MALNVIVDFGVAREQLRSHQLRALFTQTLSWPAPRESLTPATYSNQTCTPIAERDSVVVWQVSLALGTPLTPTLCHQIYTDLLAKTVVTTGASTSKGLPDSLPLVIFTTADKCRSLWFQSLAESALYVAGQPTALWMYRLRRLASSSQGLCPPIAPYEFGPNKGMANDSDSLYDETISALVDELYQGIEEIESVTARRLYSVLTLQRLVFLQQLQQKGWLNGDTWYLQTRFGAALQQGVNLFFSQCLRPLYCSLSLPRSERPLALQSAVGAVPFLGQLFDTHPLEEKYPQLQIRDQAFENLLGWLSEQTGSDRLNPWITTEFGRWLERYWRRQAKIEPVDVGSPALAWRMCDRTIDAWLLNRLGTAVSVSVSSSVFSSAAVLTANPATNFASNQQILNTALFNANTSVCRRLIQDILPELKILDPYCGSGTLLTAFYQRLTEIFSILTGYIQQNKDAQLEIWHSALIANKDSNWRELDSRELNQREKTKAGKTDPDDAALQNIQERILKNNLFGVAHSAEAAESAHFLLLSHLVATAQSAADIEPLIDLEFSVMSGNALVGFISVDEERFEQINRSDGSIVLQGNLLQPLAAESYQTIVSEKNITLEHYWSRSQLLAKSHAVPPYARAALLREEILTLDSKAQHKLDTLLLNHMSQQLGIRYRETQLADKPQRRLLTLLDVEALRPFHWGYRFNTVIKRGGFDIVACCPPWGGVKPTVTEFVCQSQDLAERKGVNEKTLKTSKRLLTQADPVVAQAWLAYQDQYAYAADYFYRSELYTHQNPIVDGKPGRKQLLREKLFVEQCINLLSREGMAAVLVPEEMLHDARSERLLQPFRESKNVLGERREPIPLKIEPQNATRWPASTNISKRYDMRQPNYCILILPNFKH